MMQEDNHMLQIENTKDNYIAPQKNEKLFSPPGEPRHPSTIPIIK